jgi:hypothetical protein
VPIDSSPDHVAVAVPDIEAAGRARWHDVLGGGWVSPTFPTDTSEVDFATRQLRYPNRAKLELLEPANPDGFAARFLSRFGARVHHVTLKVPDLLAAVTEVERAGYDVVDVFAEGDVWHEGFLRPSQVGGLIVQLVWTDRTDEDWAAATGVSIEPPRDDAAQLLGPLLAHPDLAAAERVWATLGAEVTRDEDGLHVAWDGAPLSIRVEPGPSAGPLGLRFAGTAPLPSDPEVAGAAVLADDAGS